MLVICKLIGWNKEKLQCVTKSKEMKVDCVKK